MRERAAVHFSRWVLAGALFVSTATDGCTADDRGTGSPGDAGVDASTEGGPDGGAGGRRSALPPLPKRLIIGARCRSDDDCASPFTCLTSDSNVISTAHGPGGPSNGLCSTPCGEALDACAAAENAAVCVELSRGTRYCLPACTPGGQGVSPGEKCLGRLDLACAPPQGPEQSGFCSPTCGGDFDCGGRTCDLGSGACVEGTRPGVPIGGDCTTEACGNGTCETLGLFQACTGFCAVGTVGCGFDPLSRDKLDSYCLLAATREGSSSDVGLCTQLCDCNDHCRHPQFVCAEGPADSPTTLSVRGHRGACLPPSFARPGGEAGIPCGSRSRDAGADARADASGVSGSDR